MLLREQLVEFESDVSVISASCDDKWKVLFRVDSFHDYVVVIDFAIVVLLL